MEYKVVPGPVNVGNSPDEASCYFEEIINANAVDGWEYHSMNTISYTPKPGCMQQPTSYSMYMLVFCRKDVAKK